MLDYQTRSGNQIVVAVVKTTGDQSIENYTIDLARSWGVGQNGKDNGIVLVIANNDRKVRIEVGRGLEGDLTDLQSGRTTGSGSYLYSGGATSPRPSCRVHTPSASSSATRGGCPASAAFSRRR